jgi:hypothetical protein
MPSPRLPATAPQLARLRELAAWDGMPADALAKTEALIAAGLTEAQAYDLIGRAGKRIADMRVEVET